MPGLDKLGDKLARIENILRRDPDARDREATVPALRAMLQTMESDGNRRQDPIREIFARLGDKWSPLLLLLLQWRPLRHATLWRLVGTVAGDGAISQRILRLRLRSLENDGLIRRHVVDTRPLGVQYELTTLGRELVGHIESLMSWTRRHAGEIRRARDNVS